MGLEAATYIHQLDPNNPVGSTDPKSQGDDHLKVIKATLLNTFPNVEGEVEASHEELNLLAGQTVFPDAGTFTPVVTNVANTSGALNASMTYTRIKNIVSFAGRVVITNIVAAGNTTTVVELTLPIPSNFGSSTAALGSGFCSQDTGKPARVSATAANDTISISFNSTGFGGCDIVFSGQYQII